MTKGEDSAPDLGEEGAIDPSARSIDLDAARAARAEKKGPAPYVVLDKQRYDLPLELPMEPLLAIAEGLFDPAKGDDPPNPDVIRTCLEAIFADHWPELRPKLSMEDGLLVLTGVLELYGTDLPEPSASRSSSRSSTKSSRRTSSGTTR